MIEGHLSARAPESLDFGRTSLEQLEQWFAVKTRPKHERAVGDLLAKKELDALVPVYTAVRHWSDRRRTVEAPLFPTYVLSNFAYARRAVVLRTPGVRSIVGFGCSPVPVSQEEIAALRKMMASRLPLAPWPFLKSGDAIEVVHGPLRGVRGILTQADDRCRVVISITLLQRSVAAEVDRDAIRPAY